MGYTSLLRLTVGVKQVLLQCALTEKVAVYDFYLCMVHKKMILKIRIHFIMISQFRLRWPT